MTDNLPENNEDDYSDLPDLISDEEYWEEYCEEYGGDCDGVHAIHIKK